MPESTDTAVTGRTSKAILLIPILVGWVFLSEGIQSSVDCGGWTNQGRKSNGRPPKCSVNAAPEALKNWKYAPANSETTAMLVFDFHR
ncbi:MAG: hypothetical protein DMG38_03805 [Acidobacteria bacterium]|nr:MAG: hypothetical protein DMG38_03805 [Acidobacteriota bacterium]